VKDTDPVPLKLAKSDRQAPKVTHQPPRSVIAPPRSSSVSMSDEGGRALERSLRETYRLQPDIGIVRPYDETLPLFIEQDYEFGTSGANASDANSRRRLQKALGAEVLYESYVEPDQDGWLLKSEAHEVYGQSSKPGPTLRLGRDALGPRVFGIGFGLKPWWSRILPDTIGLDIVNEKLRLDLMGASYELAPIHGEEWWSQGLRYISAINILSTPDRRREYGSRWEISAVPSLSFSRKLVKVQGLAPVAGQFLESEPEFTRWSAAGGYGLEIGYLFGRHYVYLDVIPVFNWSQISWRQNGQDRSATRTALSSRTEVGYTYVFDSNWLMRLFSRTQVENTELWQDVLVARLGGAYAPTAAQAIVSGLTFGYRFDSDRYQANTGK
jgi:hypothetical protein